MTPTGPARPARRRAALPALRVALPAWLGTLPAQAVAAGLRLLWTEWVEGALGAARPLSAPAKGCRAPPLRPQGTVGWGQMAGKKRVSANRRGRTLPASFWTF